MSANLWANILQLIQIREEGALNILAIFFQTKWKRTPGISPSWLWGLNSEIQQTWNPNSKGAAPKWNKAVRVYTIKKSVCLVPSVGTIAQYCEAMGQICVYSMFTFRYFWTRVCACVRDRKRTHNIPSDNGEKYQGNGRKMRVRSCSLKDRMRVTEWHLHLCPKSERCVSKRGPFQLYSDFQPIFKVNFRCSRFQHPLRSVTSSPDNSKHRTYRLCVTVCSAD